MGDVKALLIRADTNTNNLVKKHNDLARAQITIHSVFSGRILASLIAKIRVDDKNLEDVYSISVREIMAFVEEAKVASGKSRRSSSSRRQYSSEYSAIENACNELAQATYEVKRKNLNGKKYDVSPFFTRIHYEDKSGDEQAGFITAKFNSEIAEFLLDLHENFTEYLLVDYMSLESIYVARLFEILVSWRNNAEVEIPLQELYRMLNVPDYLMIYKDFRKRILVPAFEAINSGTHLFYDWTAVKKDDSFAQSPVQSIYFVFFEDKEHTIQVEKTECEYPKLLSERMPQTFPSSLPPVFPISLPESSSPKDDEKDTPEEADSVADSSNALTVQISQPTPQKKKSLGLSGLWGSLGI